MREIIAISLGLAVGYLFITYHANADKIQHLEARVKMLEESIKAHNKINKDLLEMINMHTDSIKRLANGLIKMSGGEKDSPR